MIEFAAVYRQHVNGKVLFARPGSWAIRRQQTSPQLCGLVNPVARPSDTSRASNGAEIVWTPTNPRNVARCPSHARACVPRGPHHHRHLLFLDKYVLGHDRTDDHVLAR